MPDTLLEVQDLRIHFPTDDGLVKAVDGVLVQPRARPHARHRRRVGLGQERDQPRHHGPAPRHQRADQRARSGWTARNSSGPTPARVRELRGGKMAMIFQDPLSSLHPYFTVGDQIVEAYRIHHRDVTKKQARQRAIDMLGRVGIPQPSVRVD